MIVALIAAALAAQTSTATITESTDPPGVVLAYALADELADETLKRSDAVRRFLDLDVEQRQVLIDTWAQITKPRGRAVELYSLFRANLAAKRGKPKLALDEEPLHPSRSSVDPRNYEEQRALLLASAQRSVAVAWALSFFVGLGIGNFYVDATAVGVGAVLGELLGAVIAGVGGSSGDDGTLALGVAVNRIAWVVDWAGAIVNAQSYNDRVRARLAASPGGAALRVEF